MVTGKIITSILSYFGGMTSGSPVWGYEEQGVKTGLVSGRVFCPSNVVGFFYPFQTREESYLRDADIWELVPRYSIDVASDLFVLTVDYVATLLIV